MGAKNNDEIVVISDFQMLAGMRVSLVLCGHHMACFELIEF